MLLIIIPILAIVLLLVVIRPKKSGFSMSRKPLEQDNELLLMNPFDNVDYITPYLHITSPHARSLLI
jgi:hypothetical protein